MNVLFWWYHGPILRQLELDLSDKNAFNIPSVGEEIELKTINQEELIIRGEVKSVEKSNRDISGESVEFTVIRLV